MIKTLSSGGWSQIPYPRAIYEGLLKAISPGESGVASYPEHMCYFTQRNFRYFDGYIDFKGKYYQFSPNNHEAEAHYHSKAMQLLIRYHNQEDKGKFKQCFETLRDILNSFEMNLHNLFQNLSDGKMYIMDVASIIAANIHCDETIWEDLDSRLQTARKNEVESNEKRQRWMSIICDVPDEAVFFDPHTCQQLKAYHFDKIAKILTWRKAHAFATYDLAEKSILITEANLVTVDETPTIHASNKFGT